MYDGRAPLDRSSDSVSVSSRTAQRRVSAGARADSACDPPIVTKLASMAAAMPTYADSLSHHDENMELEFSLGVVHNNSFYAGVRHADWRAIEQFCRSSALIGAVECKSSTDYWYNDCTQLLASYSMMVQVPRFRQHVASVRPRLRVSTGPGGAIVSCDFKMPCVVQTAGSTSGYDTRVHINYERSSSLLMAQLAAPPPGHSCMRNKTRTIFRLQSAPDWQVHLTLVMQGAAEDLLYEVEFEYAPAQPLQGPLASRCEALSKSVWSFVRTVLVPLNCIRGHARSLGPSTLPALVCEMPSAGYEHAREVGRICQACVREAKQPFVGAMPRNLNRAQLSDLRADAGHVMAADKTDGLRLILVVCKQGVFTVNRANSVAMLDSRWAAFCAALQRNEALCGRGATVLDGELVLRHGTHNSYTLVVFDLLMNNGCPMETTQFHAKAAEMHSLVTSVIRPAVDSVPEKQRPFDLRAKRFVPLKKAAVLTHRMEKLRDREFIFRYDDTHAFVADGFVLVHQVGSAVRHYKWKPAARVTVDFLPVPTGNGRVRLDAGTDGTSTLPIAEIALSEREWYEMTRVQLDSELATRMLPPSQPTHTLPIVECGYNTTTCAWHFVAYRTDKRMPNHVSVLVSTVLEMVEAITVAELFAPIP